MTAKPCGSAPGTRSAIAALERLRRSPGRRNRTAAASPAPARARPPGRQARPRAPARAVCGEARPRRRRRRPPARASAAASAPSSRKASAISGCALQRFAQERRVSSARAQRASSCAARRIVRFITTAGCRNSAESDETSRGCRSLQCPMKLEHENVAASEVNAWIAKSSEWTFRLRMPASLPRSAAPSRRRRRSRATAISTICCAG